MAKAKAKPVKKDVRKPAPQKAAPAKKTSGAKASSPAPKKAPAAAKPAPKKSAPKPAAKKPANAPAKNAPIQKVIVKKAQAKQNSAQKPAAKKAVPAKKSAPQKKAPSTKPAAKPKAAPSTKPEAKKEPVKKPEGKKLDIKEIISKKLGSKVVRPSKPELVESDEAASRASAGIHFTMEDLMEYLDSKGRGDDKSGASASSKELLINRKKAAVKVQSAPKKPMAAASIADILGFNPLSESRAQFEEKDVPKKWKKYYKLLMDVKKRFASVSGGMADAVAPAKEELTHEQAVQGMDAADMGSKNFERDMAYSLLSNEQAILGEVDAAIDRMRDGTYGVCEVTGKPIPESRLMAIPWTRCTIEGQRQKEADLRRQKAGQARNVYGEIVEDIDDLEVYDEHDE